MAIAPIFLLLLALMVAGCIDAGDGEPIAGKDGATAADEEQTAPDQPEPDPPAVVYQETYHEGTTGVTVADHEGRKSVLRLGLVEAAAGTRWVNVTATWAGPPARLCLFSTIPSEGSDAVATDQGACSPVGMATATLYAEIDPLARGRAQDLEPFLADPQGGTAVGVAIQWQATTTHPA